MQSLFNRSTIDKPHHAGHETACQNCHCPCCCRRYHKTTAIDYAFLAIVMGIFFIAFYRF
jgi:hypothetical protein